VKNYRRRLHCLPPAALPPWRYGPR
jgi:hypothetical protein